jgi:hypothetical protein
MPALRVANDAENPLQPAAQLFMRAENLSATMKGSLSGAPFQEVSIGGFCHRQIETKGRLRRKRKLPRQDLTIYPSPCPHRSILPATWY